ncbi:type II toxin-antitoxin system RelE/ParE family toxin [Dyadobacter fermentans]|uniref:type II toxin-antitoxin system RelE/ParE family toxin n=1 Tax=Dyadobacter fermentans TaxID=94254 RepID=UPI001CC167DF|nr:type II toxin-antitoxin system RelE/ParE family toxin [Dyadobacter fermentans]
MARYNILLLKTAEIELNESYEWYEKQKVGLGNNFIGAISSCLNSIAGNPYKYAKRYGYELRFAPVLVFPFIIAYRAIKDDRVIHIVSIFHTSRNPKKFFS